MNGGNGTMDACGKLAAVCKDKGISVMGIPKTMDNDIAVTDHRPGFGSIARYMAGTVRELAVDVRSLPIHVVVLESLGRNAGWATASAAFAREQNGDAPYLIFIAQDKGKEGALKCLFYHIRTYGATSNAIAKY